MKNFQTWNNTQKHKLLLLMDSLYLRTTARAGLTLGHTWQNAQDHVKSGPKKVKYEEKGLTKIKLKSKCKTGYSLWPARPTGTLIWP